MKTVAQLIREDASKLMETIILPKIEIKRITKDMRAIIIDGEKAGALHYEWQGVFQGFNTWRKEPYWTGEFTFRGEKVNVGRTDKILDLLPKITRLVRGVLVRQRDAGSKELPASQ